MFASADRLMFAVSDHSMKRFKFAAVYAATGELAWDLRQGSGMLPETAELMYMADSVAVFLRTSKPDSHTFVKKTLRNYHELCGFSRPNFRWTERSRGLLLLPGWRVLWDLCRGRQATVELQLRRRDIGWGDGAGEVRTVSTVQLHTIVTTSHCKGSCIPL